MHGLSHVNTMYGFCCCRHVTGCLLPSPCQVCCSLTMVRTLTLVRVCWETLQEQEASQEGEERWAGPQGLYHN